jgi:hypothetical protein
MKPAPFITGVLLIAFCVPAVFGLRNVWRGKTSFPSASAVVFWRVSEETWRALGRAGVLAIYLGFSMGLILVVPPLRIQAFGIASFAVAFGLTATIALFNWPKVLVPPPYRSDAGLIRVKREKWRKRRTKRQSEKHRK